MSIRAKVMEKMKGALTIVRAEEGFRRGAAALAQGLPAAVLDEMAQRRVPLSQLLSMSQLDLDQGIDLTAEGEYLLSLSEDRLLELLQEAVPDHAQVIAAYPDWGRTVLQDIRGLLTGGRNGDGNPSAAG